MNRLERRMKCKKARRWKKMSKRIQRDEYLKLREDMFCEAWIMHFGHTGIYPYVGATCHDCIDYLAEVCKGGRVPEECMKKSFII